MASAQEAPSSSSTPASAAAPDGAAAKWGHFDIHLYKKIERIGKGRYGVVHRYGIFRSGMLALSGKTNSDDGPLVKKSRYGRRGAASAEGDIAVKKLEATYQVSIYMHD